jgi:cytidyltransferase-like protein
MKNPKLMKLSHLAGFKHHILCHGTFDLLHIGHIRYLKWAHSLMPDSILIATLTADAFISKGKGRPAFDQNIRAESLAALECVSLVAIVDDPLGVPAIEACHPAIYAKGCNSEVIAPERELVEKHGGRVATMPICEVFSSTDILTGAYLASRAPITVDES